MTSLAPTKPVDLSTLGMSELIRAANGHHAKAESVALQTGTLMASALDHALSAGAALAEAKSRLKHGEWLPWLEANFSGGQQTAQRYMRLHDRQGELPNTSPVTHFGLKEALKFLAKPKPKPEPAADDSPDEATEHVVKPFKEEPGVIVSGLLRYLNDMHERWPPGESFNYFIAVLRQVATRLEKIEQANRSKAND